MGCQLAIALSLALGVTGLALPTGDDGLVVATMAAAIPIIILRTPAVILLERRLEYRLIASSDVAEGLVFYGWAVGTVAAGLGVWGMATAVILRSIVGSAILIVGGPIKLVRPRWDLALRPLLGFGLDFHMTVVLIVLEQVLNVAIAAVAASQPLGLIGLAGVAGADVAVRDCRRVAFPALSRLLDADEDPRPPLWNVLSARSPRPPERS